MADDRPASATRLIARTAGYVASDRHLARYVKYVEEFSCFLPPER